MTEETPEIRTVVVERRIPFPPERIWRALTQPHLIAEWLMKNDFTAEVGHKFQLSGDWGGTLDCEVLEVDPQKSLSYSWNFVAEQPEFDLRSTVTFTLTASEGGTILRMEQAGFRPHQTQAYHGARAGWQEHLANLEKAVARLVAEDGDA